MWVSVLTLRLDWVTLYGIPGGAASGGGWLQAGLRRRYLQRLGPPVQPFGCNAKRRRCSVLLMHSRSRCPS